jgi:hypothetical protein
MVPLKLRAFQDHFDNYGLWIAAVKPAPQHVRIYSRPVSPHERT